MVAPKESWAEWINLEGWKVIFIVFWALSICLCTIADRRGVLDSDSIIGTIVFILAVYSAFLPVIPFVAMLAISFWIIKRYERKTGKILP